MKQKRLENITSFLTIQDAFIDIGTDHAYIPIHMAKKGCQNILATDIHPKALEIAKKNIAKEHLENQIKTVVADGLKKIDTQNYDTLVIAGMGASTIIKILSLTQKLTTIKNIIIESNNDLEDVRRFMNKIHYGLVSEKVLKEKKHYYVIMKFVPMKQKLKDIEYEFGLFQEENKDYYLSLQKHYKNLYQKIPENRPLLKEKINEKIQKLECLLEKDRI